MLRWMTVGVLVLAGLWGGWWVIGSAGIERGIDAAVDEGRARGWQIEWTDLSVAGFPSRFDTTITAPEIGTPDGQWSWSAPFLQVFALSYRPNHVIAVAPNQQSLSGPAGDVAIESEDLRASVVVSPGPSLALDRATVAAQSLTATLGARAVSVAAGQVALRAAEGAAEYDIAVGIERLGLPDALLAQVGLADALPPEVAAIRGDATVRLDRPLDRRLTGAPGVVAVSMRDVSVDWGAVGLSVSGDLQSGAGGFAEGALVVELDDLEAALDALGAVLTPEQVTFARAFLGGFGIDGRPGAVRLDLPVRGGRVALGPIPLVVLPRFSEAGS